MTCSPPGVFLARDRQLGITVKCSCGPGYLLVVSTGNGLGINHGSSSSRCIISSQVEVDTLRIKRTLNLAVANILARDDAYESSKLRRVRRHIRRYVCVTIECDLANYRPLLSSRSVKQLIFCYFGVIYRAMCQPTTL